MLRARQKVQSRDLDTVHFWPEGRNAPYRTMRSRPTVAYVSSIAALRQEERDGSINQRISLVEKMSTADAAALSADLGQRSFRRRLTVPVLSMGEARCR